MIVDVKKGVMQSFGPRLSNDKETFTSNGVWIPGEFRKDLEVRNSPFKNGFPSFHHNV